MNRKRLFLAFALGLLLTLLCVGGALAATDPVADPLKVSMELSSNQFSEPKKITVSITVSNVGESDMPSPVTLYYPNGKQVEEFGSPTLAVGVSKNWSGSWTVTQKELDAGKITFKIKYSVYNDDGELVNKTKNFSKRITYTGGEPEVSVNRVIAPTTAQKGQEVSITYEIENTSAVDITSVTIKENSSISGKSAVIEKIAAGETEKHTFVVTMGTKDLKSAATITYKAGGKSYSTKVEEAVIHYGEVKLSATLTADKKGGAPGDTVKLALKLKNSGNVDFTNVTVTDEALGTVFSGESVPAGETVTLETDVIITESQELQFHITAEDDTGEPMETATGRVSLIATDPTQQIVLRVEASADREVVHKIPGTVRFNIQVHNDSAVDISNITVKAVETTVYTFESIPAGKTGSFTRDMDISMPGSFQFTASCKDQLGQTVSFASNIIPISYAEPTPVPTEVPVVTPPAPVTEAIPTDLNAPEWLEKVETIADTAKWVLAGLTGVGVILLLIGGIRRGIHRSQSKKAMDHLEGGSYRDYSMAPRRGKRSEVTGNGTREMYGDGEEEQEENTAQDSELMAETLKRLYNDTPPAEEKDSGKKAPVIPEQAVPEADAPTADAPTEDAPTEDVPGADAPTEDAPEAAQTVDAAEAAHRRRGKK